MQTFIPDYRLEPEEKNDFIPVCPVCGKECDTVYVDAESNIAGCDRCITMKDAYESLYEE